jgi:alcohol dehydrogenase
VVDPDLLSCRGLLIAADGMDARSSSKPTFRPAQAYPTPSPSSLAAARDRLLHWYEGRGDQRAARSRMAWAALASGLVLAQGARRGARAGRGARGALSLPHGYLYSTLTTAATAVSVAARQAQEPANPRSPSTRGRGDLGLPSPDGVGIASAGSSG